MKRIICLLLAALLVLGSLSAALAAGKYTSEPEKLLRQIRNGSGVKGTLSLNTSGTADWAQLLAPLNGQVFQLRALDKDSDGAGFQYRMYLDGEEGMYGMTEVVSDGKTGVFTSEFLPGQAYSMPAVTSLPEALMELNGGNPGWYTLLLNMSMLRDSEWKNDWAPKLTAFNNALELWLAPYLTAEVVEKDGETLILSRYAIPAQDVKEQAKSMLSMLMNNQALLTLLAAQTGSRQAAVYLQPEYLLWYAQVLDAMPMTGDIILERSVNAQGEERGWLMDFQLGTNLYDLREVVLQQEEETTEVTLIWGTQTLYLSVENADPLYTGMLRIIRDEGDCVSLSYTLLVRAKTSVDKENRNHEDYDLRLTCESDLTHLDPLDPERDRYVDFGSLTATLTASLYSKSSDTTPVTVSAELNAALGDSTLQAVLTLKSAQPWKLPELSDGPWTDLSAMTADQREALWTAWFQGCLEALGGTAPADEADVATETDIEE